MRRHGFATTVVKERSSSQISRDSAAHVQHSDSDEETEEPAPYVCDIGCMRVCIDLLCTVWLPAAGIVM